MEFQSIKGTEKKLIFIHLEAADPKFGGELGRLMRERSSVNQ